MPEHDDRHLIVGLVPFQGHKLLGPKVFCHGDFRAEGDAYPPFKAGLQARNAGKFQQFG